MPKPAVGFKLKSTIEKDSNGEVVDKKREKCCWLINFDFKPSSELIILGRFAFSDWLKNIENIRIWIDWCLWSATNFLLLDNLFSLYFQWANVRVKFKERRMLGMEVINRSSNQKILSKKFLQQITILRKAPSELFRMGTFFEYKTRKGKTYTS